MSKQYYIQNQDGIPDTNNFIYKDKKYPIKLDLIKLSSKYFMENQFLIQNRKDIPLKDDKIEQNIIFTDESIQSFIKFLQFERILLDNDNVSALNYLAKKYKVITLENITNEYIFEHHQDLILQILA